MCPHFSIGDISADAAIQNLDLSNSSGLQRVRFSCPDRVLSLISWLPAVLANIPVSCASTLRSLEVAFLASRQFHLDRPFLHHLSKLLAREAFQGLHELCFVVHQSRCDKEILECAMAELEHWAHRGVLKFVFMKDPGESSS